MTIKDFVVRRDDLSSTALVDAQSPEGSACTIDVERFALTANNVTYGVAGDMIGYWQFFPALDGWGRIPVWGIGSVSASSVRGIEAGQRYYGYYPMSHLLAVSPNSASPRGFTDASAHRAALPVVYNQYSLMTPENGFDPAYDNHHMVYRPLFTTSFVIDDYFADNDFFGAKTVILGSASSKTAFGTAFMMREAKRDVRIVGLTSASNRAFVDGLGLYDEVVSYDDIEALSTDDQAAYIDMSGNPKVLSRVHHHFAEGLVSSCGVGITHWESRGGTAQDMPGAKPAGFFAPTQIAKRNEEWGPGKFQQELGGATRKFFAAVDQWVTIEEHGFDEVDAIFRRVLEGASPDRAYVVTVK